MQATDDHRLIPRSPRREGVWIASALTLALSLVTAVSGKPAGWEPLFPIIFAVVLFTPVLCSTNRMGSAAVVLVGLTGGLAGFISHFLALWTGWLHDPPSDAVLDAFGLLAVIFALSGVLFVSRASVALVRDEPRRSVWLYLATATICIATVQAAWIIRFW